MLVGHSPSLAGLSLDCHCHGYAQKCCNRKSLKDESCATAAMGSNGSSHNSNGSSQHSCRDSFNGNNISPQVRSLADQNPTLKRSEIWLEGRVHRVVQHEFHNGLCVRAEFFANGTVHFAHEHSVAEVRRGSVVEELHRCMRACSGRLFKRGPTYPPGVGAKFCGASHESASL